MFFSQVFNVSREDIKKFLKEYYGVVAPGERISRKPNKDGKFEVSSGGDVILKNNKPRYVVVDFDEYEAIVAAMQMREAKIEEVAEKLIDKNMEALLELAK